MNLAPGQHEVIVRRGACSTSDGSPSDRVLTPLTPGDRLCTRYARAATPNSPLITLSCDVGFNNALHVIQVRAVVGVVDVVDVPQS
jgi:hypothetical protein